MLHHLGPCPVTKVTTKWLCEYITVVNLNQLYLVPIGFQLVVCCDDIVIRPFENVVIIISHVWRN